MKMETCSICYEVKAQEKTLCCGHSYCKCCINNWLTRNATCPICREKVRDTYREYSMFFNTNEGSLYQEKVFELMTSRFL